ncbi:MAG TPA: GMC oxidoreductase [Chitinophagales bacterium]|nr:GMC oxidoreductase [Chitinophagales bacterium]
MSSRNHKINSLTRRKFISLAGLGIASFAMDACKKDSIIKKNNQPCTTGTIQSKKIIIVGSGFGGSIAAKRLTAAGHEVTLLERGKEWKTDGITKVFSDAFGTTNKAAWLTLDCPISFGLPIRYTKKFIGLLEKVQGQNIAAIVPACLGGGSVSFGGIWAKPNQLAFSQIFPASISYSELESTYIPRVLDQMKCTEIPDDIYRNNIFKHNDIFKQHNEKAGIENIRLANNFNWNTIREEIDDSKIKSATIGECVYGTNSGAKITTNDTYLKDAKGTGNLEIITQSVVQEITLNCDDNYLLFVDEIDEEGKVISNKTYSCDYLFLAAGSVGTSKLLTKAKEKNTIPNLNEHIGKGFGNNGMALFLRSGISEPTGAQQSFPPIYAAQDVSNPTMPLYIEHFPFNFSNVELNSLGYNFMGLNSTRGYFEYKPATDKVELIFPARNANNQRFVNDAAKSVMQRINQDNSGSLSSLLGSIPVDNLTYHPLGGVVLTKATDISGRVLNNKKLYVIDGAMIPGATCCNPALTISALAEKNIEHILNEDF